jgi:hypothetical protein
MAQRRKNATTPEEIRDDLYKIFNQVMARSDDIGPNVLDNETEKVTSIGAAASSLARAIMETERELAVLAWIKECRERGDNIASEMDKGLIKSIVPLNTIKLKPPGV